jgi:hypothetical protein
LLTTVDASSGAVSIVCVADQTTGGGGGSGGGVVTGGTPCTVPGPNYIVGTTFYFGTCMGGVVGGVAPYPNSINLTVTPPPAGIAVGSFGTVAVTIAAPTVADLTITLSVDDVNSLTVPSTVTILAGQSSATFQAFGVTASPAVQITASVGTITATSPVAVG